MRWLTWILSTMVLLGCQDYGRQTENYGTVSDGPGGINIIISEEHQGGWGRSECLMCHNASLNVHRNSNSVIDPDALNEEVWRNGGSRFCLKCHGPNGVE